MTTRSPRGRSLSQRWCEQAQGAGALDGLGPTVRAELGVQVAHVGLDGACRDGELPGDLRRRQVGWQVSQRPDLAAARVITHPSRFGAAVSSRTSADPTEVCRNAPSADSQNRCGSGSSRPSVTHAARSARPDSLIQDLSSTVLPLPAGADTTVTRADAPSRSNRPRRETTPPAPGPATRRAADPELPAGRIAHDRTNVIHPVRAVQGRSGRSTAAAKGRPLPYA